MQRAGAAGDYPAFVAKEKRMACVIGAALFLPAVLALVTGFYWMVRWVMSRRGASNASHLLVGILGPLATLFPRAMSAESARYLRRSMWALAFFLVYCALLMLILAAIGAV